MRAVDELALRIRTGNIDPTRGNAILAKACANCLAAGGDPGARHW